MPTEDGRQPSKTPAPAEASAEAPAFFSWAWFKQVLSGRLIAIPGLLIGFYVVGSLLMLVLQPRNLEIQPIGVPESLSKAGFTTEAATARLADGIGDIQDQSQASAAKTAVVSGQGLLDITVPDTGISLNSIASFLRRELGWQREISGEFVESDNHLSLRLRLNGRLIFSGTALSTGPEAADQLISDGSNGGAFRVVQETQPYVAAVYLYSTGDLTGAEILATDILDRSTNNSENTLLAHNLEGLIANQQGDGEAAESDFWLASRSAIGLASLGAFYSNRDNPGDMNLAFQEYHAALRLDPSIAAAYYGLGVISSLALQQQDQTKIERGKTHDWRGITFYNMDFSGYDLNKAVEAYQHAIQLNPKDADPHKDLGGIYGDPANQGYYDLRKAVAEYRLAAELAPDDPDPHNSLGNIYCDRNSQSFYNFDDAVNEYQLASDLAPDDFNDPDKQFCKGEDFVSQNQYELALKAFQDASAIHQALAGQEDANPKWQPLLRYDDAAIGNTLQAMSRSGALAVYQKALAIDKIMVDTAAMSSTKPNCAPRFLQPAIEYPEADKRIKQPKVDRDNANNDATEWPANLADDDSAIGDLLFAGNDMTDALAAYQEAQSQDGRLANQHVNDTAGLANLGYDDRHIGNIQAAQGNAAAAISSYQGAVLIHRKLIEKDKTVINAWRNLADDELALGNLQKDQNNLPDALKAYQNALAAHQSAASQDKNNAAWQQNLSDDESAIGDLQRAMNDLPGALASYRAAQAIDQNLANDKSNKAAQINLAADETMIGDLMKPDDPAAALAKYRDALVLYQNLAAGDKDNPKWQADMSTGNIEIGNILMAQKNFPAALEAYRKAQAIDQGLLNNDKTNTKWQSYLAEDNRDIAEATKAMKP